MRATLQQVTSDSHLISLAVGAGAGVVVPFLMSRGIRGLGPWDPIQ